MITMEILGKIRRMYLRDKLSLHEITKRTGLSRNTIRSWLRKPEDETAQPAYVREKSPGKLSPYHATLELAIKADALRNKQNRRTAKALFIQIKADGYAGCYCQVTAFVRDWRGREGKAPHAFVPLKFELGARGVPVRLERREPGDRRHLPAHAGIAHEAVRQPRLLAGGLPESGT